MAFDQSVHQAVKDGSLEEVNKHFSLSNGKTINSRDSEGKTPLMLAAEIGDAKKVRYLSPLSKLNLTDRNGNSAIELAAKAQHKEIVDIFLNQKKRPKKKIIKNALNSGLTAAIVKDPVDLDMISFFIEKGAVPSSRDIDLIYSNEVIDSELVSEMAKKALNANKKKGMSIIGKGLLYMLGPGAIVGLILVIPPLVTFVLGAVGVVTAFTGNVEILLSEIAFAIVAFGDSWPITLGIAIAGAALGTAAVVVGVTSATKTLKQLFSIGKENRHYKKILKELKASSVNKDNKTGANVGTVNKERNAVSNQHAEHEAAKTKEGLLNLHEEVKRLKGIFEDDDQEIIGSNTTINDHLRGNGSDLIDTSNQEVRIDMPVQEQSQQEERVAQPMLRATSDLAKATESLRNIKGIIGHSESGSKNNSDDEAANDIDKVLDELDLKAKELQERMSDEDGNKPNV